MSSVIPATSGRIRLHEQPLPADAIAEEVHEGLSRAQKSLPPKLFYDQRGSRLFEAITRLPEYYPTRTEIALLEEHVQDMAALFGTDSYLLELGSGSSIKIRLLLEAVRPAVYIPMDISREHLIESSQRLAADYPWLRIHASCVDYSRPWDVPDFGPGHYNAFFPGSSIGNFDPASALKLLKQIRRLVGRDGGLLIGVDLKKDRGILEAAYNDSQGVTADFNLNMLLHLNRRVGADFDTENFSHRAIYNAEAGRIEMHLDCIRSHAVHIDDKVYPFSAGESIHTESSYKYSVDGFHALAAAAGFSPQQVWTDSDTLFSIHYLKAH